MLGIAVSPYGLSCYQCRRTQRGKQMGYVYFAWLLYVGWAFMNVLVKLHPTRFAFMMSLVVVIAWYCIILLIKLTNYNTKPVSEQLGQIVDVMKRHLVLFPGILLQGASISALLPTTYICYKGSRRKYY